jgi:hypothetical protein
MDKLDSVHQPRMRSGYVDIQDNGVRALKTDRYICQNQEILYATRNSNAFGICKYCIYYIKFAVSPESDALANLIHHRSIFITGLSNLIYYVFKYTDNYFKRQ